MVIISWKKIYGTLPSWWELVCILIHDIGHLGKDYLDNYEEKKKHAELGSSVAGKLFGMKGYDLVFGHNAYNGQDKSNLYYPDKYSWTIAPIWWMITNTYGLNQN